MEADLLKIMAPMGVGGLLAAFIFWCYRQDRLACKEREKILTEVLRDNAMQNQALASSVQEISMSMRQAVIAQGNDMRLLLDKLLEALMKDRP